MLCQDTGRMGCGRQNLPILTSVQVPNCSVIYAHKRFVNHPANLPTAGSFSTAALNLLAAITLYAIKHTGGKTNICPSAVTLWTPWLLVWHLRLGKFVLPQNCGKVQLVLLIPYALLHIMIHTIHALIAYSCIFSDIYSYFLAINHCLLTHSEAFKMSNPHRKLSVMYNWSM